MPPSLLVEFVEDERADLARLGVCRRRQHQRAEQDKHRRRMSPRSACPRRLEGQVFQMRYRHTAHIQQAEPRTPYAEGVTPHSPGLARSACPGRPAGRVFRLRAVS